MPETQFYPPWLHKTAGNVSQDHLPFEYVFGLRYIVIPIVGLAIVGALVCSLAYHIRKRRRLDEWRHKLIPTYEYDPGEQEGAVEEEEEEEGWDDDMDEEQQLTEPLCGDGVGLKVRLALKQD